MFSEMMNTKVNEGTIETLHFPWLYENVFPFDSEFLHFIPKFRGRADESWSRVT